MAEKYIEAVEALAECDVNKAGFKLSQMAQVAAESFTKKSSQKSKRGGSGGSGSKYFVYLIYIYTMLFQILQRKLLFRRQKFRKL